MIDLGSLKHNQPIVKQDLGILEFFLSYDKPVATVGIGFYRKHIELLKEYPSLFEENKKERISRVTLAKDGKTLNRYKVAKNTEDADERFKLYGELYGFPETAINYFVNGNTVGDRYKVNYYGLSFVCKRKDIEQIENELLEMYGLPFDEKCCYKKEF